ncbi:sulfotransferase domain-containing protein [Palleronia sp.]|uniref:sulfotransferase domain-containing protein n=1 Tax=Palleronia sp. TaxID=1940284 RepID=UPI0035C7E7A8
MSESAKRIMPQALRNAIRPEVYLAQRGAQKVRQMVGQTGRWPHFLILGAQKAGTTTLYDLIMRHPDANSARTKEIAFFDRNFKWGLDWYKSNFPDDGRVTGEATPCYLYDPEAAQRIINAVPSETRFIVLLRDPVDRAISHYFHARRLGYETLPIEEALDAEERRIGKEGHRLVGRHHENRTQEQSFSYIARGHYSKQLERYFSIFPKENFYIETSNRLFADPETVVGECYDFLGLKPSPLRTVKPRNVGVYSDKVKPEVYEKLREAFSGEKEKLEANLGRNLPW